MSIEHDYFLGLRNTETGIVSLLGPYNKKGEPLPIFTNGSWSTYWESFRPLDEKKMNEDIKKFFKWDDSTMPEVSYTPLDIDISAPITSKYVYSKTLMELKDRGADTDCSEVIEATSMSEGAYALFCKAYLRNPEMRRTIYSAYSDEENIETTPNDYDLYSYFDFDSTEYEKWMIGEIAMNLGLAFKHSSDEEVVVLEVHG